MHSMWALPTEAATKTSGNRVVVSVLAVVLLVSLLLVVLLLLFLSMAIGIPLHGAHDPTHRHILGLRNGLFYLLYLAMANGKLGLRTEANVLMNGILVLILVQYLGVTPVTVFTSRLLVDLLPVMAC